MIFFNKERKFRRQVNKAKKKILKYIKKNPKSYYTLGELNLNSKLIIEYCSALAILNSDKYLNRYYRLNITGQLYNSISDVPTQYNHLRDVIDIIYEKNQ